MSSSSSFTRYSRSAACRRRSGSAASMRQSMSSSGTCRRSPAGTEHSMCTSQSYAYGRPESMCPVETKNIADMPSSRRIGNATR